jgi:pyrrolysine biosynthesis protein PylC
MRLLVAGGRLQGTEAAYLAREAGWEVLVADVDSEAPAAGLCDEFLLVDVTDEWALKRALRGVDLVVPALEDLEVLPVLERVSHGEGIPIAYDPRAYRISSCKIKSDRLFAEQGVPAPRPGARTFPVIAKPSGSSGSDGVRRFGDEGEFQRFKVNMGEGLSGWVIQEYLEGPSYSLEVVGTGLHFRTLQVTQLEMDPVYDCKRVLAPADLETPLVEALRADTVRLARAMGLVGVMDIEVILNSGRLQALEIDARLPSQTPTAVYKSSDQNLLEWLKEVFVDGRLPEAGIRVKRAVIYEHVWAHDGVLEVTGEHIMGTGGHLSHRRGFFGACEALTNFRGPWLPWVATLINTGSTMEEAWAARDSAVRDIMAHCGLGVLLDEGP